MALCASFRTGSTVSHQTAQHALSVRENRSLVADVFLSLRKPPRIFRTGQVDEGDNGKKGHLSKQSCGETVVVTAHSDKDERCPPGCPFYVQNKLDDKHCSFVCVPADQCAKYNPIATVPDEQVGACRQPWVEFCKEYELHLGGDHCAKCKGGFFLGKDGACHYKYWWLVYGLAIVLVVATVLLLAFVINMGLREKTNEVGLIDGLQSRSAQKLRQLRGPEGRRDPWPITTNLMTTQVAGPGMALHFNFQMVIIVWAFGIGVLWTIISYAEDPVLDRLPDLMRLGTRRFGMPRENCIMVAWGYEKQMEAMWIKVAFLAFIYLGSFVLAIYHSIRQLRIFEKMDCDNTTMTDFAVLLSGLPLFKGTDNPEELIRKRVQDATGQEVLGVSIAWDFLEDEERVMKEVKEILNDVDYKELSRSKTAAELEEKHVEMSGFQQKVFDMETYLFAEAEEEEDDEDESKAHSTKAFLDELCTTEHAFVVFKTEACRNDAVEKTGGSFEFNGSVVTMQASKHEPDTVQWQNFGHSEYWDMAKRLALGFGYILLGLLVWTIFFYGPYAWSVFKYNYENGNAPGMIYGLSFSMVVVVGNAIMYEICARVADMMGFYFRDNREACYMMMYTIACTFNVLLDFASTYVMVFEMGKGLDFRSHDGQKLRDIDTFTEQFETYPMQRLLGENAYSYAFPSTYLIPFLIEPIVTIYGPLKAGMLIVRSHPEIRGGAAEEWLAAAPMDMGRYADCLLDVVLAVLVLYFPGGWTWQLYFALAFCHVFIYAFDQWKVLRNIPSCTYASMDVDWWSQAMFAPCIAMILSCLVFKANCQGYGFCVEGYNILFSCSAAFFLHCVVHILLLVYFVPTFATVVVGADADTNTYQDCASKTACSWFTANPVHCLRSKYTFGDEPECMYFMPGKEHCQKVNEKIGVYFSDSRVEMEDYDDSSNMKEVQRTLTRSITRAVRSRESVEEPAKDPGKRR